MADDEQFSLCWNNFNSNLSAGFHESLCRGDLVDVTLAAEGQFVKAHRLVLSVCSPYFRKMFTQMPANQHAFVFLKDVSHTALKDLIQFMYCGEVNVKQEALPAFISTAEALQIKGLTDGDPPPSQSPAEPSTPTPPQIQQITSPRVRQRTSTSRSYKIETLDDAGDDKHPTQIVIQTTTAPQATIAHQPSQHIQTSQTHNPPQQIVSAAPTTATTTTVVSHKRPSQRSIGAPHIKRTKSTIDPLEVTEPVTQQITVQTAVVSADIKAQQQQQQSEPEYIDLPMELPTKSEPDYTEEGGEVEAADEAGYVEDDSYGDIRYDEAYFAGSEDATPTATTNANAGTVSGATGGTVATTSKAIVKQQQTSFSDSSYVESADQANNDAQEALHSLEAYPSIRKRGRRKLKKTVLPEKLIDKIQTAMRNNPGQPTLYASTTKGGMKLIYEGHHFRYSFRKGQYSIFQCCYKENKAECKVKVVTDQKLVYPLDGEHVHFIPATDRSVTCVAFEPGDLQNKMESDDSIDIKEVNLTGPSKQIDDSQEKIDEVKTNEEIQKSLIVLTDSVDEPLQTDITTPYDPYNFREKIKKRLQKALLGKKK